MFVTGRIHHIPDAATCLAGIFLLTVTGVLNGTEIGSGISWDLVIFIGVAMSFGAVFGDTGISEWLVGWCFSAGDPAFYSEPLVVCLFYGNTVLYYQVF